MVLSTYSMFVLWLIAMITVGDTVEAVNSCPMYAPYHCGCSAGNLTHVISVKMCLIRNVQDLICRPCPMFLQDLIECKGCPHNMCFVCSVENFMSLNSNESRVFYPYADTLPPQIVAGNFSSHNYTANEDSAVLRQISTEVNEDLGAGINNSSDSRYLSLNERNASPKFRSDKEFNVQKLPLEKDRRYMEVDEFPVNDVDEETESFTKRRNLKSSKLIDLKHGPLPYLSTKRLTELSYDVEKTEKLTGLEKFPDEAPKYHLYFKEPEIPERTKVNEDNEAKKAKSFFKKHSKANMIRKSKCEECVFCCKRRKWGKKLPLKNNDNERKFIGFYTFDLLEGKNKFFPMPIINSHARDKLEVGKKLAKSITDFSPSHRNLHTSFIASHFLLSDSQRDHGSSYLFRINILGTASDPEVKRDWFVSKPTVVDAKNDSKITLKAQEDSKCAINGIYSMYSVESSSKSSVFVFQCIISNVNVLKASFSGRMSLKDPNANVHPKIEFEKCYTDKISNSSPHITKNYLNTAKKCDTSLWSTMSFQSFRETIENEIGRSKFRQRDSKNLTAFDIEAFGMRINILHHSKPNRMQEVNILPAVNKRTSFKASDAVKVKFRFLKKFTLSKLILIQANIAKKGKGQFPEFTSTEIKKIGNNQLLNRSKLPTRYFLPPFAAVAIRNGIVGKELNQHNKDIFGKKYQVVRFPSAEIKKLRINKPVITSKLPNKNFWPIAASVPVSNGLPERELIQHNNAIFWKNYQVPPSPLERITQSRKIEIFQSRKFYTFRTCLEQFLNLLEINEDVLLNHTNAKSNHNLNVSNSELRNATVSGFKHLNYNCPTCSILYKLMSHSGLKVTSLMTGNIPLVIALSKPNLRIRRISVAESDKMSLKKTNRTQSKCSRSITVESTVDFSFMSPETYQRLRAADVPLFDFREEFVVEVLGNVNVEKMLSLYKFPFIGRFTLFSPLILPRIFMNSDDYDNGDVDYILFLALRKIHEQKQQLDDKRINLDDGLVDLQADKELFPSNHARIATSHDNIEDSRVNILKISSLDTKRNGEVIKQLQKEKISKNHSKSLPRMFQAKYTPKIGNLLKISKEFISEEENATDNRSILLEDNEFKIHLKNPVRDHNPVLRGSRIFHAEDSNESRNKANFQVDYAVDMLSKSRFPRKDSVAISVSRPLKGYIKATDDLGNFPAMAKNVETSDGDLIGKNHAIRLLQKASHSFDDSGLTGNRSKYSVYPFSYRDNLENASKHGIVSKYVRNLQLTNSKIQNETEFSPKDELATVNSRQNQTQDSEDTVHANKFSFYVDPDSNDLEKLRRADIFKYDIGLPKEELWDDAVGGRMLLLFNESKSGEDVIHLTYKDTNGKSRLKRSAPQNQWCQINNIIRHGNMQCTVWSYKKECAIHCHNGFTINGAKQLTVKCSRKQNQWQPEMNACGGEPGSDKREPGKSSPSLDNRKPSSHVPDYGEEESQPSDDQPPKNDVGHEDTSEYEESKPPGQEEEEAPEDEDYADDLERFEDERNAGQESERNEEEGNENKGQDEDEGQGDENEEDDEYGENDVF